MPLLLTTLKAVQLPDPAKQCSSFVVGVFPQKETHGILPCVILLSRVEIKRIVLCLGN